MELEKLCHSYIQKKDRGVQASVELANNDALDNIRNGSGGVRELLDGNSVSRSELRVDATILHSLQLLLLKGVQ